MRRNCQHLWKPWRIALVQQVVSMSTKYLVMIDWYRMRRRKRDWDKKHACPNYSHLWKMQACFCLRWTRYCHSEIHDDLCSRGEPLKAKIGTWQSSTTRQNQCWKFVFCRLECCQLGAERCEPEMGSAQYFFVMCVDRSRLQYRRTNCSCSARCGSLNVSSCLSVRQTWQLLGTAGSRMLATPKSNVVRWACSISQTRCEGQCAS